MGCTGSKPGGTAGSSRGVSAVNKTRETTGVEVEDGTSDGAKAAAGPRSASLSRPHSVRPNVTAATSAVIEEFDPRLQGVSGIGSMASIVRGILRVDVMVVGTVSGGMAHCVVIRLFSRPETYVFRAEDLPLVCEESFASGGPVLVEDVRTRHDLAAHAWLNGRGPFTRPAEFAGLAAQPLSGGLGFALVLSRAPLAMSPDRWEMFLMMDTMAGDLGVIRRAAEASGLRAFPPLPESSPEHVAAATQLVGPMVGPAQSIVVIVNTLEEDWPIICASQGFAAHADRLGIVWWGRGLWSVLSRPQDVPMPQESPVTFEAARNESASASFKCSVTLSITLGVRAATDIASSKSIADGLRTHGSLPDTFLRTRGQLPGSSAANSPMRKSHAPATSGLQGAVSVGQESVGLGSEVSLLESLPLPTGVLAARIDLPEGLTSRAKLSGSVQSSVIESYKSMSQNRRDELEAWKRASMHMPRIPSRKRAAPAVPSVSKPRTAKATQGSPPDRTAPGRAGRALPRGSLDPGVLMPSLRNLRRGSLDVLRQPLVSDLTLEEEVPASGLSQVRYRATWRGAEVDVCVLRHLGPDQDQAFALTGMLDQMLSCAGVHPNVVRPFHYACHAVSRHPLVDRVPVEGLAASGGGELVMVEGGTAYLCRGGGGMAWESRLTSAGPRGRDAASVGALDAAPPIPEDQASDARVTDGAESLPGREKISSVLAGVLGTGAAGRASTSRYLTPPADLAPSTGRSGSLEFLNETLLWETWVVVERSEVGSLLPHIRRGAFRADEAQPASCAPALEMALDCARALQHLHTHGVVHGNLSPSSIKVHPAPARASGLAYKVEDYGLCQLLASPSGRPPLCIGYGVRFHGPERFISGPVLPSADVFSLGLVLIFALTGVEPFKPSASIQDNVLRTPNQMVHKDVVARIAAERGRSDSPVAIPSTVPADVADLIRACTSKDPKERPTSGALIEGLDRLLRTIAPSGSTGPVRLSPQEMEEFLMG